MKPRSRQLLPRTLVVCFAPLLVCATASAEVMIYNESSATNVWSNIRSGTNLLAGATVVAPSLNPADPVTPPVVQEGSTSSSWATLTDGVLGTPGGTTPPYKSQTVTPNNGVELNYALNLTGHPDGYDITSFDSFCMWGDGNRDNQDYAIQYSTDGVSFNTLAVVANGNNLKSTHTYLSDSTGVMAMGVKYIKIIFGAAPAAGQENGYTGFSEFILRADPINVMADLQSSPTNGWTLPAGTNLLNGATATATPASTSQEGSSTSLALLTNGALGASADISSSLTPGNNTSIVFPLNTAVNFNGYNLSSIDTYCAWPNSGRDDQSLDFSYATVDAPSTFIPLSAAVIHTPNPGSPTSTRIRLTPVTGVLAARVGTLRVNLGHQENGYVGYREFIALGTPVSISDPLTWTGASGSGGNANWIAGADNNWKKTIGGAAGNFSSLAALTFDSAPANRNITVATSLTASSMAFTNDVSHPYVFGGAGLVTVSNDITTSGAGAVTFNSAISSTNGVTQAGSGALIFNGALTSSGAALIGTGGITLNGANPGLTGTVAVSDGTLTVSNNNGLQNAGLSMAGGIALFTSAAPLVANISSSDATPGAIKLGKIGPVNTVLSVGDSSSVTAFGGPISQVSGTVSGLTKTGGSSLTLSGENTYTGATTVLGGTLQFDQLLSFYHGNQASWTPGNVVVASGGTLGFKVNSGDSGVAYDGEFLDTSLDTGLALGGFASGSFLGINATTDVTLARNLTQPGLGLVKSGPGILNITGANTSNGLTKIFEGAINLASTTGSALNGNVLLGNASAHVFLNFAANNQVPATSVFTFSQGNFYQTKINLRGTNQTIAGLDSAVAPANRVSLIQNDEIGQPGYTGPPAPATLTINATTDHSFYGLIRDQDGGAVSVTKMGPGTQEFQNITPIQGYGYTGPTLLNEGKLRINFTNANNSFNSPITIASIATLNFHSVGGGYDFNPIVSGPGKVVVTGTNPIALTNGSNSWTGGTTVDGGFLALKATNANGQGDGPGQTCVGGAMDPSNVINIINGGTLSLDNAGALGNSPVLPQYAPSIHVNEGSKIFGGTNTIAFVSNITLDGGTIEATNGASVAGFNTNLCLVGTVVVGGVSALPSQIITNAAFLPGGATPSANANISLGSVGAPGTTFQVADVTAGSDLVVGSILTNVNVNVSALTKTGPGTMELQAANTYTGPTHVVAGELRVNVASLADGGDVVVDTGATLNLQFASVDYVSKLTLGGAGKSPGIYGSLANTTPGITQTGFITGPGMLYVSTAPATAGYDTWAQQIPNAAARDRTADPDGDGFRNIDEYLFGTSPNVANGSLVQTERTSSGLVVRWNQRATGTSVYELQESTTLIAPWATSTAPVTNNPTQDLPDYIRKVATVPVDSARKFVRVKGAE